MRIVCTTSNAYVNHILPVFIHLFQRFWGSEHQVEVVGYKKPDFELPANFTFYSMGEQGDVSEFTNDLKRYFEKQDDYFVWLMEDTFLTNHVNIEALNNLDGLMKFYPGIGKICLTNESMKRGHQVLGNLFYVGEDADYRLSSQPSIWRREFLLDSMTPDLNPWQWETQNLKNDGWIIVGYIENTVQHNEGVRKHDIHKLNIEGIDDEIIKEMKGAGII